MIVEVCVAIAGGVMLLFWQAVAERPGIAELPVQAGGVEAIAVLQQLRGGWVGERAAAPRAVLVRLWPLRLETRILQWETRGEIRERLQMNLLGVRVESSDGEQLLKMILKTLVGYKRLATV